LADAVQRLLAASEGNMRKSPAKTTVSAMM
jgi:hypothetical protein